MDIQALNLAAGASGASAGAVSVPVDSRVVLTEIASTSGLTDGERAALAAAVAAADGLSGELRSQALSQVQGMGIYLRHTGDEGLPRWSMMTALRAYGLNLAPGSYSKGASESGVAAVHTQLAKAVASRGVTVEHAISVAKQIVVAKAPEPAPAPVAKHNVTVEKIV